MKKEISLKYDIDFDIENVYAQMNTTDKKISKKKSEIHFDKSLSLTK